MYTIITVGGCDERKRKKIKFPKDFFTKSRPHASKQEKDYIPFQWSENVLSGKSKAKIVSLKIIK